MVLPRMLHARLKLSPHASARIVAIDTEKARKLPGVRAVLTGADLPYKLGLYMVDKDILARDRVRHQGEAVAAVAADTVEQAEAAVRAIEVTYEPLPAVLDVHASLASGAPQVHPDLASYSWMKGVFFPVPGNNTAHHQKIRKGDVERGFAEADRVFTFEFRNRRCSTCPWRRTPPSPRLCRAASRDHHLGAVPLHRALALLPHFQGAARARCACACHNVGGGFGGKAGIHLEPLVYCLSKAAGGRPVKIIATREEEFNTLPSRQGLTSRIKTGVKKDGRLTALEIEFLWDAGAYADYGVNIGRAAAYAGAGPYVVPNCKLDSKVVYTNKVYGTAYRGFGHLEALWGIERNLDLIARALGVDPYEIRRKNLLRPGETTITGELFTQGHGRPDECLRLVKEAIGYDAKGRALKPVKPGSGKVRAKGLAMLHKAPAMPTYTSCSVV